MADASSAPLRITIVQGAFLPVPPRLGGAVEKAWYALGREFARQGHHVTHLGRAHGDLPARERDAGVDYVRIRGYDTPSSLARLKLLDLFYSLRACRRLPPADILVTNTFWLPVLERRASRGRPYVHVARYPKGQLRFYPRRTVLQTVSDPIREAIVTEAPDAAGRTRVIPYPLAPVYLAPLEPARAPVLLYTGRIHPEKGLHLLVDAFARFRRTRPDSSLRLRIIGPWREAQGGGGAGYRARLVALAAHDPAVEVVEPIFDEQRLVEEYRRADLFAYPSLAERGETFGLAVLEAMAGGCVPLVSDLACFRDFVRPNDNGIVFDHRHPAAAEQLAARLVDIMSDPGRRASLREQAWRTADDYRLERIAAQFIQDFRRLVAPAGSSGRPVPAHGLPA